MTLEGMIYLSLIAALFYLSLKVGQVLRSNQEIKEQLDRIEYPYGPPTEDEGGFEREHYDEDDLPFN